MNQHFVKLLWACAVLCMVGCAKQNAEEIARSVEITVQTADGPVAGASVKIVDEQAAAQTLVALAGRENLTNGIPTSLYEEFFRTLAPAGETDVLTTDAAGKVVAKHLRPQHFVAAHSGEHLWLAAASDTRNRKLRLSPEKMGGQDALELLVARPAVAGALATAAREALGKDQFDQARALARASQSSELAAEIDHAEVTGLLKQAEEAIQRKDFETAQKLAAEADRQVPGRPETKALLSRMLKEYGGKLRTMMGHQGAVTGVAYSPDGRFVLSGSEDKTLKLWDAAEGKEVRTLTGHRGAVTSVAFAPAGNKAASGGADGTVRLWDVTTGDELHTTEALGWKVTSVAFSPDGSFVVSGADDNQVTLWKVPGLERVRTFGGHGGRVTSVAFNNAGNWVLSGSEDDSIKLWNVATGLEVLSLRNGLAAVTCVAFSPDGQFCLSGDKGKSVKIWNVANGREIQEFKAHTEAVRSVAFSHDGRFAISAGNDGTVRLWDIGAGNEFRAFADHAGAALSVAVNPDGHYAVSGHADGTIDVWQLPQTVWSAQ